MSPSLSSPFTLVTIYALWVSLSAEAIPRSSSCSLWGDPTRVAFFLHVCDPSANTSVTPSSPAQCSVESALRHNPDWEIWVLTNCWNRELFNQEPLKKSRFRYIRIEDLFGQIPLMKEVRSFWHISFKWLLRCYRLDVYRKFVLIFEYLLCFKNTLQLMSVCVVV